MLFAFADAKKGGKNDEKIYLLHSDELFYDAKGPVPDASIVKGNVRFMHKGGLLDCDSAYFYEAQNSLRAMGHVYYREADTLKLNCERAYYDGLAEMMEARQNVVLVHNKQTLYTDSLNFDRIWNNAYFYDGGRLVDGTQTLTSDWGTYNTSTKDAVFYYNVVLINETQRVETDTMHYSTDTSLAHVVGPSTVYQDSTIVHTTDGFFDKNSNTSRLYKRSTVVNGFKTITGDSLFYDSATGDAYGYGRAIFVDSENRNELHGDYMQYNEKTGYGYATDRAVVKDYSQGPDTLFVHGDTIKLFTYFINTDSVYRMVHCYNNVRAFRNDVQAICDSLVGDSRDSCMTMYIDPIAWNGERQILGEVIKIYSQDSTIREANVIGQALSIEQCDDENHWNQISSKFMNAYFADGKIREVHAIGNVKAIYYPIDEEDSTLMLLNYTETDTLRMYLTEDRQIDKIWTCKHVSDMYPLSQIPADKYRLPAFAWFDDLRPRSKYDIFDPRKKSEELRLKSQETPKAPKKQLFAPAPETELTSEAENEAPEAESTPIPEAENTPVSDNPDDNQLNDQELSDT